MSKSRKATQGTNWGDMKRVLVNVQADENGLRGYKPMEDAIDALLKEHLEALMSSSSAFEQEIRDRETQTTVGICSPVMWLPDEASNCPPQFVLCAPREWFREGVPDYTGPIKGETAGAK